MKQLPLLIQIKKNELDQWILQRTSLEQERMELDAALQQLIHRLCEEEQFVASQRQGQTKIQQSSQGLQDSRSEDANHHHRLQIALAAFRLSQLEEKQRLTQQIAALTTKIESVAEQITELFHDIKRYEHLLQRQEAEKYVAILKEEGIVLDAMGQRQYRNQKNES